MSSDSDFSKFARAYLAHSQMERFNFAFASSAMDSAYSARIFPCLTPPTAELLDGGRDCSHLSTTPTGEAQQAHDIILGHLSATMAGCSPPQLLMLVQGPSGGGKTALANRIKDTFHRQAADGILAVTACTRGAAFLVDGQLLYQWAGLSFGSKARDDSQVPLPPTTAQRIRGVKYLIIDQASQMSRFTMHRLDGRLRHVRCAEKVGRADLPFGGVSVILFADFHALRPVMRERDPLFRDYGTSTLRHFKTRFWLEPNVEDTEWMALLRRFRSGFSTAEDSETLSGRVVTSRRCPLTDFDSAPWNSAPLLTSRMEVAGHWNSTATRKHSVIYGSDVVCVRAVDETNGRALDDYELAAVAAMTTFQTGRLKSILRICVGMPVIIPLPSGSLGRATVKSILFDGPATRNADGELVLGRPPCVVYSFVDATSDSHELVAYPLTANFRVYLGADSGYTSVKRTQLDVKPAFAMTYHDAEGYHFDRVILDLASPPFSPLEYFEVYSALSKVRALSDVLILRDLPQSLDSLFPPEDLLGYDRVMYP